MGYFIQANGTATYLALGATHELDSSNVRSGEITKIGEQNYREADTEYEQVFEIDSLVGLLRWTVSYTQAFGSSHITIDEIQSPPSIEDDFDFEVIHEDED